MGASLLESDETPVALVNGGGRSPYVLISEHASNRLPKTLGTLGLPESDLERHIAWDIGAEKVARLPPDAADAIPEISETTHIPGNLNLSPDDKLMRIHEIYRPFHAAIADLLDRRAAEGTRSMVVTIHSFTPVYKGRPRAVELGILHDRDTGLADKLITSFPTVDARLNEPYGPKDGVLHTLNLHAAPRGLRHAMIEIRNDFLSDERGQGEWAERLSASLVHAAAH